MTDAMAFFSALDLRAEVMSRADARIYNEDAPATCAGSSGVVWLIFFTSLFKI
jgi:hypothetical protein